MWKYGQAEVDRGKDVDRIKANMNQKGVDVSMMSDREKWKKMHIAQTQNDLKTVQEEEDST